MKDQNTVLLNHMGKGHKITRFEAILNFGIQNITARILDIRSAGVDVKTRMKHDPNGKRYAQYYITAGEIEHALNSKRVARLSGGQLYLKGAA